MKPVFGCPVKATSRVMSGKWKVAVLWHLSFGRKRFAQIRNLLDGVSEKVLTDSCGNWRRMAWCDAWSPIRYRLVLTTN